MNTKLSLKKLFVAMTLITSPLAFASGDTQVEDLSIDEIISKSEESSNKETVSKDSDDIVEDLLENGLTIDETLENIERRILLGSGIDIAEKKDIEIVSGDGTNLNISPVYDNLDIAEKKDMEIIDGDETSEDAMVTPEDAMVTLQIQPENLEKIKKELDIKTDKEILKEIDGELDRDSVVHLSPDKKQKLKDLILKQHDITDYQESELIFLNNLPIGTKIIFNKDFIVLPKQDSIIIKDGKIILDKPDVRQSLNSYCSVELRKSGRARVIKAGRDFIVVKNVSDVKKITFADPEKEPLKIQKQIINVENEHIKNIYCVASSPLKDEKLPLMIYDLYKETDNAVTLAFPAYEEI